MTPQDLIASFDTLAEAPDGVKRLRELVLQLAVRGKLVPQQHGEEPVSADTVDRLPPASGESSKTLRRHRTTNQTRAAPAETRNWVQAPLGSLLDGLLDFRGRTPKKLGMDWGNGTVPALSALNVRDGGIDPSRTKHFGSPTLYTKWMTQGDTQRGDVLLTMEAPLGKVAQVPDDAKYILSQRVVLLKPRRHLLNPNFLAWSLRSPTLQEQLRSNETGTTVKGIRASRLVKLAVALPPLAEQKRIVARVDELIGLLDRLEAARNAREATRTALRDAALAALADADTPAEVDVAWQRIAGRMDDLFTARADVAPLRQTVLQLAVRGRLVPQDPDDEPAGVLLERIAAEKARLVKAKKIREPKVLPQVSADEVPFAVPEGWTWSRLGDLLIDGPKNGWSPKGVEYDTGVRTLKLSATTKGVFDARYFKFVDAELDSDSPLWLRRGDLLVQRSNTPAYVGIAAIYDGDDHTFIYPDLMMRCRLSRLASTPFVHKALVAPFNRTWLSEKASGTSQSMVKVNQGIVRATLIPIAPLSEQERIVARVDELMGLLDRLEQHLASKTTTHDAFAAAAVHHLDV